MGDYFIAVVDPDVEAAEAAELGAFMLRRLIDRGYVLNRPDPRHGLGGSGYPPGPGAPEGVDPYLPNGLVVDVGREVYGFAQGEPEAVCPSCGAEVDDAAMSVMFSGWPEGDFDGRYRCADCGTVTHANDLPWDDVRPVFGALCLTFWNWPPDTPEVDELVADLAELTGHALVSTYGKL